MKDYTESVNKIFHAVEESLDELKEIRTYLYENPEIGGEEEKSSAALIASLKRHGFTVTENYYDVSYAFKAVYDSGKPGAAVGIFAEYDALPEIGHGCGHDLICTSSLGAAYGLKAVVSELGGKIIVFGTPGEENLQIKTVLAPKGAFDEADVGIMAHPFGISVSSGRSTAIESLQVEFFGVSAHAGSAPEQGINALDAAVYCYQMINQQKEYYPHTNIHGIINEGGSKASVIPDYASLKFLTRAWDMKTLAKLRILIESCAKAAAEATRCKVKVFNNEQTNAAMNTNYTMAAVFDKYLLLAGETDIKHEDFLGSTDMGDVSVVLPSIHALVGLGNEKLGLHSREFGEASITEAGDLCIERAAKALACTGMEVLADPDLLKEIKKEYEQSKALL